MDRLSLSQLQSALGPDTTVHLFDEVGSTNTELIQLAKQSSVHKHILTAEFQSAGRGRRGRGWVSPYARNLAISLGWASERPAYGLQGASLVVGMGVHDALHTLGAGSVQLKWPNDVLAGGNKVCGILVEVVSDRETTLIAGIGINVDLDADDRAQIDQPVDDLRSLGVVAPRTEIAIEVVRAVLARLERFEATGFAPMIQEYDKIHAYQGRDCRILIGDEVTTGRVMGVSDQGHLRLATAHGERKFNAGEVSLRG